MERPHYVEVLKRMGFTDNVTDPGKVRIVRHKSAARAYFDRGWQAFEEFQRFQAAKEYGQSEFVVAFLGQTGKAGLSTFVGVYRVSGVAEEGTPEYLQPSGTPDLLAELTATKRYRYDMRRLVPLDSWIGRWEVDWQLPHPAWSLKMKGNLPIMTTLFEGEYLPDGLMIPALEDQVASFPEGALKMVQHARRERSTELVKRVKALHKSQGTYKCVVCEMTPGMLYANDIDCLECHHTVPLHTLEEPSNTLIDEMVLLCANCHTAVHRHKPWLAKHELSKIMLLAS